MLPGYSFRAKANVSGKGTIRTNFSQQFSLGYRVSNLNSKHGTIEYYDSLFHGRIRDHVKLQICNIYKSENSLLQINIRSCHQQSNGVDCGIYAVANAFYILSGTDVSNIKIDENKMRRTFFSV